MTDEQVKSTARAINQYWWHDDTDLLDFTRAVLARARMADEALLRQALEALVDARVRPPHKQDSTKYDAAIAALRTAIKERLE